MSVTKQSIIHWVYNIIVTGYQEVEGLKCYQCTDEAQKDKKCHFASSGDGPDDDTTWFGDLMECDESADHCMIGVQLLYVQRESIRAQTLQNNFERCEKLLFFVVCSLALIKKFSKSID